MQKSIAFIIRRLQDKDFFGGGERISFNLIKHLCKLGYKIDVFCHETNVDQDYGINEIIPIQDYGQLYSASPDFIQGKKYDRIISENLNTPLDTTIAHGHSVFYRQMTARNIFERTLGRIFTGSKKLIMDVQKNNIQHYNLVIVPSMVCKKDYSEYLKFDSDKIRVIYPGIETRLNTVGKQPERIFSFGISAVGFSNKGGYLFLNALFMLKMFGYRFRAKIIYPGYKKNKFVKILARILDLKNNLEFVDFQTDMTEFYSSIDCMVVPSKLETFGLVVLEAMSDGVPVILSSRCGSSEIINDGENGFVFDYESLPAIKLFAKMRHVLNLGENLRTVREKSLETAKKYSWEKYCKEFTEALFG